MLNKVKTERDGLRIVVQAVFLLLKIAYKRHIKRKRLDSYKICYTY